MPKQAVFNRHIDPASISEVHGAGAGLMKLDEILDQRFLFELQSELRGLSGRGELIRVSAANGGYGGHNYKLRVGVADTDATEDKHKEPGRKGKNTSPGNYSSDITIADLPVTTALSEAFAEWIYNPLMSIVTGSQFRAVPQIESVVVYNQPAGGGGIPRHRDYGNSDHSVEGYGRGVVGVVTVTGIGNFSLYNGEKVKVYHCVPGDISIMRAVLGEYKSNPQHSVVTVGDVDRHTIVFRQIERE